GHLLGRALDWYQISGSTLVQNTATDFVTAESSIVERILCHPK
ncbi:hypothetical protein TNCV_1811841, partial [Trichonephila clavipes]